MNRFFLSAAIAALSAVAAWGQALPPGVNPNFILNPGFEETAAGKNEPKDWNISADPAAATVDLDEAVVHSGKRSVHVKYNSAAGPKASGDIVVSQQLEARFEPGKTYTYSAYIKTKGIKGYAYLDLYEYPAPIPREAQHRSAVKPTGTTDWQRAVVTFTARKEIDQVQIRCAVWAPPGQLGGEVWFDDCKLEEGAAATAFTDTWEKEFYTRGGKGPWHFPVPYDFKPSTEVVTPCADPARPGTRKIQALFILHYSRLRLPAEMAERMDLDADSVAMNAQARGYIHHIFVECAAQMRERLKQNPSLIVMDADTWNLLMSSDRDAVLDRVKAGAGMLFCDVPWNGPEGALKETLSKAQQQKDAAGKPVAVAPYVSLYRLEAGRIVVAPGMNTGQTNTFQRESVCDRMVRALYAAAGAAPVEVRATEAPGNPVAGKPWEVQCSVPQGAPAASIRLRLRPMRQAGWFTLDFEPVAALSEQKNAVGPDQTASFSMGALPAGNYFLEASALNAQGGVIGWSLTPVNCAGTVRLWPGETPDPRLAAGKPLEATARIENRSEQERTVMLAASVLDTEGRIIGRAARTAVKLKPGMNGIPVRMDLRPPASPEVRLRTEVSDETGPLDSREDSLCAEALLPEPDFRFLYYTDFDWGMRPLGADTAVTSDTRAADAGMRLYPWTDIMPCGENWRCLTPADSVTSPETRDKVSQFLAEYLGGCRPWRTVGCIIQDEWTHRFVPAQAPADTAYFRTFLKQMYGGVEKLNQSWGTELKSFDEVTLALCAPELMRDKGASPARWADLQRMYEVAVAEYIRAIAEGPRKTDPEVRLGLSGTQESSATDGLDWWLLTKAQGCIASYGGVHDRCEEWFRSPATRLYQWSYPSQGNVGRSRHDPWRDLFRQRDGYLHYGGHFSELFAPDYRPFPAALACSETVRAIRNGPARLVRTSTREDYGIGILYSMASYHASHLPIIMKTGPDLMNDVLNSTDAALGDVGLDSRFYSYEQLARGEVTPEKVKAFFLPYSLALSAEEAAAARKYVEEGGLLIADLRPAVFDEHCHALKSGALDDVFGIEPPTAGNSLKPATLAPPADFPATTAASVLAGEMDLRLKPPAEATAKVAVEEKGAPEKTAPALVVNSFGKGKAVVLNCAFPEYNKYRAGGIGGEVGIVTQAASARPIKLLLAALLKRYAGIEPAAQLADARDGSLMPVQIYAFRDGPATYLGFVQAWDEEGVEKTDCKLRVNIPGELYDVLAGKHLGKTGEFPVTVERTIAHLYAVLPYEVKRLTLDAPRKVAAGQELKFKALVESSAGKAGRHVFVARLTRPDGASREWDRSTIIASEGRAEAACSFALNDPPGNWTLTVTDAATGVKAETPIEVAAE